MWLSGSGGETKSAGDCGGSNNAQQQINSLRELQCRMIVSRAAERLSKVQSS